MKLILMALAAFVLGLGGGVTVTVLRAPPPKPLATAPAEAGGAVRPPVPEHAGVPAASTVASVSDSSHAAPVPAQTPASGGVAHSTGTHPPIFARVASTSPTLHAKPAPTLETYRQVARILSNMKPADAAKIIAYLGDDQVEGILRALGVRPAAVMLSVLPSERAASMSRRLLLSPATEGH